MHSRPTTPVAQRARSTARGDLSRRQPRTASASRPNEPMLSTRAFVALCVISFLIAFLLALTQSAHASTLELSLADHVPGSADIATFATNAGSMMIGSDKPIQNSSTTVNGTLTLAGVGGVLLSNSDTHNLTLQDGTTKTMIALATSGQISVTSIKATGGSRGITKTATGTLALSGAGASTYTGVTAVNNGQLDPGKNADVTADAGNRTIGDRTGSAGTATVRPGNNNQITKTSDVTSYSGGTFNLNSKNETIDGLSSSSSSASNTLGTGTLTVGANNESSATLAGEHWQTQFWLADSTTAPSSTTSTTSPMPLPPFAPASTITWVGGGSASAWLTAANWSSATVPSSGDIATFSSNAGSTTIGIDMSGATNNGTANQIVGEIAQAGGENKTIENSSLTAGTLTLAGVGGVLLSNSSTDNLTIQNGSGSGTMDVALNASGEISVTSTGLITISSIIKQTSGPARGITKTGTGTLVLSGTAANTYTGVTAVNDGQLDLSKSADVTAVAGNLTIGDSIGSAGSAILRLTNNNQIANTSDVTINSDGTFNLNSNSETIDGLSSSSSSASVTLGSGTLTVGASDQSSATFAGVISGTGNLAKSGTGTQTLTGSNTYTGTTTINAGVLNIQNANALGGTGTGTSVSSGATLQLQGGLTFAAEGLTITGTGAAGQNGALVNVSGTNNYAGLLTLGGAATISSDSGTLNLTNTGTVSGATFGLTLTGSGNGSISSIIGTTTGTLTKSGTGTWTLAGSAANTYTGATTINAGELDLNKSSGNAIAGTTVTIGDGSDTDTLKLLASNQIADGATLTLNSSGVFNLNGFNETISQLSSSSSTASVVLGGSSVLTISGTSSFSGVISGTGGLTKSTGGTLTFTGANTYSGTTTISAGTLQIGNGGTSGTLGSGSVTNNAALSFNRSDALSVSNLVSGTGSVTQAGSGTTTLTANNTYTGATNVNAGKLLINGNQSAATGAVSVSNSGTVLGGTGTIGGAVTVNSGAAILGGDGTSASGTLSVSNSLTLNSGSIIELALGSSFSHSTLARSGSGTWTFQSNQQFTFIELSGVTTGTYQNIITGLPANPGTGSWIINNPGWTGSFTFDGANIDLTLTAVPEPSTWAAATLALVALLAHRRRRRFTRAQ